MPQAVKKVSSLLILLLFLGAATGIYTKYYYESAGPLPEPTNIIFRKGMGFQAIVDHMAEKGVIRHPLLFKVIAAATGDGRRFKAGEYAFSAGISPRLVMDMIAGGQVVVHKITIPEGLTAQEIKELLAKEPVLEGGVPDGLKEGFLLPETYHYTYGDSRQLIAQRMQASMQALLAELWPKRKANLPIRTVEEAVVLASIVEKETGVKSERPRVAAVFINRLNRGMKLQSDPTVAYGVEKDKGPLKGDLTSADLKYDSRYNTYMYEGLPPAPIANPGRASIEAVLNPPETKELYFVATGTGGHNFSETLAQHNAFVQQYRKTLKEQKKAQ